jgi:hypothetical protein
MRSLMPGLLLAAVLSQAAAAADTQTVAYPGPCDASAAVAMSSTLFLVANDEDNVLRANRQGQTAPPVYSLDLSRFLAPDPDRPEVDLEAAAPVGNRIYWIASHSTSGKGKASPGRRRFFATDVSVINDQVSLAPVGLPYKGLVQAFEDTPALRDLQLAKAATIAPELPGGLNIEGLSATPTGELLIGFRNPVPEGKALLIPLKNPAEVIAGKSARLGSPIALDLAGRGVRSIEYVAARREYLIVAGPAGDGGAFGLYRWSGNPVEAPRPVPDIAFTGLQPEAMAPDGKERVWIFSDDGSRPLDNGKACKDTAAARQSFRGLSVAAP